MSLFPRQNPSICNAICHKYHVIYTRCPWALPYASTFTWYLRLHSLMVSVHEGRRGWDRKGSCEVAVSTQTPSMSQQPSSAESFNHLDSLLFDIMFLVPTSKRDKKIWFLHAYSRTVILEKLADHLTCSPRKYISACHTAWYTVINASAEDSLYSG
jgi:hypothetical protein